MDNLRPHRSFVSYIDRSREYYAAQGYSRPYAWAHHDSVPFTPLPRPLSGCRVGLVTTTGRTPSEGLIGAGGLMRGPYAEPANPPPQSMFTNDLFWDKNATHTNDIDSFLPINRLAEKAGEGLIGSASPRFYGVPTDYSQSRTSQSVAPQLLEWCREDDVDAVILLAL